MIQMNKVLFPTDFSRCAEQAFPYAVELARRYEAELHILHASVLHGYLDKKAEEHLDNLEEIQGQLEELAASRMSSLASGGDKGKVSIQHVSKRGMSAAPVILDYIDDEDIDLTVMGTHGRRGLEHIVLGSVAEEVVRVARCPVLTVRESETPQPIEAVEKILVPVDFSDFSLQAVVYAKELASSYQARLQLLHVVEPPIYPSFYALKQSLFFDLLEDIKKDAKKRLKGLMEETEGPTVSYDVFIMEGRAVTDIPDFAKNSQTDLLVIATHGLTGLKRLCLGSVTEKVVRRARCPVLTVRAFGKSLYPSV
jgi:nucleotide-binding universal stress UspA family protein